MHYCVCSITYCIVPAWMNLKSWITSQAQWDRFTSESLLHYVYVQLL